MRASATLLGLALAVLVGACTKGLVLRDVVQRDADVDVAGPVPDAELDAGGIGRDAALCPGTQPIEPHGRAAQVLVLLDYSQTMREAFDGTSRLLAAETALAAVVRRYARLVKFGLELFPAPPDDPFLSTCRNSCCAGSVGDVTPDLDNEQRFVSRMQCLSGMCPFPTVDSPSGDALDKAMRYFSRYPWSYDDRFVWLVTSSEPTCSAQGAEACTDAGYAVTGLRSYANAAILGVGWSPDAKSCWWHICESLASSKSKLPHGDCINSLSSADALNKYMTAFASKLAQQACTLFLEYLPPDQNAQSTLTVKVEGQEVKRREAGSSDGWDLIGGPAIQIHGTDCDNLVKIAESKTPSIEVSYPCSWCAGPGQVQCFPIYP